MYIGKMTSTQINDMLKAVFIAEARFEKFYNANLASILDLSLFEYNVEKSNGGEYLVAEVKNGDVFVFDDCNYVKFIKPQMIPLSYAKNLNVFTNYMKNTFDDYYNFEKNYNQNCDNIVNFVNFCDDLVYRVKKNKIKSQDVEITII